MSVLVLVRALRPHQWVKNILLWMPLLMAHQILNYEKIFSVLIGTVAFSLCASSVYLLNDLLDVEADRAHPVKRHRPIASGALSAQVAWSVIGLLMAAATVLGWLVSVGFLTILLIYFSATLAYSIALKERIALDVMMLALFYTLRVLAGGEAASVQVSAWLLCFSLFFFFSLACVKRYSELLRLQSESETTVKRRGYRVGDLPIISALGVASGALSALVLALYITSDSVMKLYSRPGALWLLCPLLLYWITRIWILASRSEVHEDPVVFALHDRASYLLGLIVAGVVLSGI
jgi:4-hydroxybenzoate polyprenyltransferase